MQQPPAPRPLSRATAAPRPMGSLVAPVVAVVVAVVVVVALGAWLRARVGGDALPAGTQRLALEVGGESRRYLLDLPDGTAPTAGWPLLLVLHGGGGSAAGLAEHTGGLVSLGTDRGWVVARPEGLDRQWSDGRIGGRTGDDVGFLLAAIDDIAARTTIDRDRVHVAGISNGAFMAARLACEPGARIAGIAEIAGTAGDGADAACAPDGPVTVVLVLGRADPIVPYEGGVVRLPWEREADGRGVALSGMAQLERWAGRNGAGEPVPGWSIAPDATSVVATAPDGARAILVTVDDGGHGWPGGPQYLPEAVIGRVTGSFNASVLLLDVFEGRR